jgi:DNA excision repair protein ERCC-3
MSTPREERRVIIDSFEHSTNAAILFVSRTGDEALDVPSASAGIVFWNHWASRRQIVQRIGRLSRVSIGPSPVFYVLLADDPREIQASKHREEYLSSHGFVVDNVALADSRFVIDLRPGDAYVAKLRQKAKAR